MGNNSQDNYEHFNNPGISFGKPKRRAAGSWAGGGRRLWRGAKIAADPMLGTPRADRVLIRVILLDRPELHIFSNRCPARFLSAELECVCGSTAYLRIKILDFTGSDSSRILTSRGDIFRSKGDFPEMLSQGSLA